jgi:hypothetical protein
MKLSILVLEGCMHSAVAGIADLLTLVNHVMRLRGAKGPLQLANAVARRQGGAHGGRPVLCR